MATQPEEVDLTIDKRDPGEIRKEWLPYAKLFIATDGEGLKYHSFEDIGRYTVFPENHWRRMFRRRGFGFIEK